jgi:ribosomal protein L12E/L44/L45/RPP1/RPP2
VKLEMVNIDEIFANAEQSEYDLFSMGRGQFSGKKAGAAQTNDDAKEEECQTDEVCWGT